MYCSYMHYIYSQVQTQIPDKTASIVLFYSSQALIASTQDKQSTVELQVGLTAVTFFC